MLSPADIFQDAVNDEIPEHRFLDCDEALNHEGGVGFSTLIADVDLLEMVGAEAIA
ncbi:hypothetical protein GCM10020258_35580 [Sphingomonas yabuuchiae]